MHIVLLINYFFIIFSIGLSLQKLMDNKFCSILAATNLIFIFQNMIGAGWLPAYLKNSSFLTSFNEDVFNTMVFYHIFQSSIFLLGCYLDKLKLNYLNTIFIKIIIFLIFLVASVPLFIFSVVYEVSTTFLNSFFFKIKSKLIFLSILSLSFFLICFFIVIQSNLQETVKILFFQTSNFAEMYSVRNERLLSGMFSGYLIDHIPMLSLIFPPLYFNIIPFLSIYYLNLKISKIYTKNSINFLLLFLFIILFLGATFISLSTLGKARFSIYILSLSLCFIFPFWRKQQATIRFSNIAFFAKKILVTLLRGGLITISVLFLNYWASGAAASKADNSFLGVVYEFLQRTFIVPIASSYSWFYTYPAIYEHPMLGTNQILSAFLQEDYLYNNMELIFNVSRVAVGNETGLVTNFIAYAHANFGSIGLIIIIVYTLTTTYIEKSMYFLKLKDSALFFSVYCFVYPNLITAVNTSFQQAVLLFGVWLIPCFAILLGNVFDVSKKNKFI